MSEITKEQIIVTPPPPLSQQQQQQEQEEEQPLPPQKDIIFTLIVRQKPFITDIHILYAKNHITDIITNILIILIVFLFL